MLIGFSAEKQKKKIFSVSNLHEVPILRNIQICKKFTKTFFQLWTLVLTGLLSIRLSIESSVVQKSNTCSCVSKLSSVHRIGTWPQADGIKIVGYDWSPNHHLLVGGPYQNHFPGRPINLVTMKFFLKNVI